MDVVLRRTRVAAASSLSSGVVFVVCSFLFRRVRLIGASLGRSNRS